MVDLCYDIKNFEKYKNKIFKENFDCLHGYRSKNIFKRSDNLWKGFISLVNWLLIALLYDLKVRDFQNTYMIKTEKIKSIKLYSKSSFMNPELILKLRKRFRVYQVYVPFNPRKKGKGTGTKVISILEAIYEILYNKITNSVKL